MSEKEKLEHKDKHDSDLLGKGDKSGDKNISATNTVILRTQGAACYALGIFCLHAFSLYQERPEMGFVAILLPSEILITDTYQPTKFLLLKVEPWTSSMGNPWKCEQCRISGIF